MRRDEKKKKIFFNDLKSEKWNGRDEFDAMSKAFVKMRWMNWKNEKPMRHY